MMSTCARLVVAGGIIAASGAAAMAGDAKIRIVFFTPRDVEPPANVAERMKQVVDYGQAFYAAL